MIISRFFVTSTLVLFPTNAVAAASDIIVDGDDLGDKEDDANDGAPNKRGSLLMMASWKLQSVQDQDDDQTKTLSKPCEFY